MPTKTLKIRCWVELDERKFFGPGRAELLALLEIHGSISNASKAMNMSYKKAWDMVSDLNTRGSQPFVQLKKGGSATLTDFGKQFLEKYTSFNEVLKKIGQEENDLLAMV